MLIDIFTCFLKQFSLVHISIIESAVGGKWQTLESHPANPLLGMMSGYHSDEEGEAVQEEVSNRVGVSNSDPSNDTKQKSVGKSLTSMDTQMEDFLKVLHYTLVLFVLIAIYTVESHYSEAKRGTN